VRVRFRRFSMMSYTSACSFCTLAANLRPRRATWGVGECEHQLQSEQHAKCAASTLGGAVAVEPIRERDQLVRSARDAVSCQQ
jgi:hypothetical protein